jgi:predicted DCC family thiol-disulfide oxidoreductase YuxK
MVRRFGGDPNELTTFYVIADYQSATAHFFTRSDAALFVASQLGWPWRAAIVARCLPTTIRNYAYDGVARTRYRVFGRYDQCVIPPPEFRSRFID